MITLKPILHGIRITMEKSLMKWIPGLYNNKVINKTTLFCIIVFQEEYLLS